MPSVPSSASELTHSVAFLDLCGFTAFTERRGDRAAVEVVEVMRVAVGSACLAHDVRLVSWLGDGCLLVSSDRGALLACCRHAIASVDALLPLPLRGGEATGRVLVLADGDVLGATVNRAARRCDAAAAGELRTADSAQLTRCFATPIVQERRARGRLRPARTAPGQGRSAAR